jgi:uncharacterized membrane protein YdcZ (DUF606 family)
VLPLGSLLKQQRKPLARAFHKTVPDWNGTAVMLGSTAVVCGIVLAQKMGRDLKLRLIVVWGFAGTRNLDA